MTKHLKKAAILIASLDAASADALLDEMEPEEAIRVRNAVMELGDIDPDEQQQIMHDFMHRGPAADAIEQNAAVELHPDLASKLNGPLDRSIETASSPERDRPPDDTQPAPFCSLEDVDAELLANVLAREHPQTTAIVVAHLAPERAADVLHRLPTALQTEILVRVARLGRIRPEVVRDIEQEMQALLANDVDRDAIGATGLATVEAILRVASVQERHDLVVCLARRDATLARHLGVPPTSANATTPSGTSGSTDRSRPGQKSEQDQWNTGRATPRAASSKPHATPMSFADLEALDDGALAQILHASSPNTTLLALTGASHTFVQRILRQLPAREADQLKRKMQQLGPLRLDDVERAQTRLAELAQRLIDDGTLTTPGNRRFAVAV